MWTILEKLKKLPDWSKIKVRKSQKKLGGLNNPNNPNGPFGLPLGGIGLMQTYFCPVVLEATESRKHMIPLLGNNRMET